jgi:hypothetical protein
MNTLDEFNDGVRYLVALRPQSYSWHLCRSWTFEQLAEELAAVAMAEDPASAVDLSAK